MPRAVAIGRIGRAHGLRGDVVVGVGGRDARESVLVRVANLTVVLKHGGEERRCRVVRARAANGAAIVGLEGVTTPEAAAALRGAGGLVDREDFPRPDAGEYYHFQLVGLRVVVTDGAEAGQVVRVEETAAHALLVVRRGDEEIAVPFAAPAIDEVDVERGIVRLANIEGLPVSKVR